MPIELAGKTVVLTGRFEVMTRKQASAALSERGAIVASSVDAGTDFLFVGEKAGSKKRKAEKLGVPIHSEAELMQLLSGDAPPPTLTPAAVTSGDLADGEMVEMKGSGRKPYQLKNIGGVYSCSCPAWRNQSLPIERRSCKHLRKLRGAEAEAERVGGEVVAVPTRTGDAKHKPPLLLAHSWEDHHDPGGWWMSEKLDGVRAWWDGQRFMSRQGNPYLAPDWFTRGLPATPLDGELWMARGAFQRTVSVVRRHDRSEHWRQVRFVVFDAPRAEGGFEQRMQHLAEQLPEGSLPYVRVLEQVPCRDADHLREELARVEGLGGEGLMLREPGSPYEVGRSTTLLKVKTFHDAEALVQGYKAGAGRHMGRVGALEVVTPGGVQFSVGTGLSDKQREAPPPVGSVITYRYQELTDGGVPRFPTFLRVREDVAWPETAAP